MAVSDQDLQSKYKALITKVACTAIPQMAFSWDNSKIAVAAIESPLKIYDAKTLAPLHDIKDRNYDSAFSVGWDKDSGNLVAGYGENGYVRIFDNKGKDLVENSHSRAADYAANLHSNGVSSTIVSSKYFINGAMNGNVSLWLKEIDKNGNYPFSKSSTVQRLKGFGKQIYAMSLSANETMLAVAGENGKIKVVEVADGSVKLSFDCEWPQHLSFINGNTELMAYRHGEGIKIWPLIPKSTPRVITIKEDYYKADYNNKNNYYVFGDSQGNLILFDVANEKTITTIKVSDRKIESLKFDNSCEHLLVADDDGRLMLFELKYLLA